MTEYTRVPVYLFFFNLKQSAFFRESPNGFDICIMDEASTVTELMVLPLLKFNFKVLVLAGDKQFQAASTIHSMNFGRSLFNRIIDSYGSAGTSYYPTLEKQYRMHSEISYWPNKQFYEQKMMPAMMSTNRDESNFRLHPYTVFSFNRDLTEFNIVEELLSICTPNADPSEYTYGIIPAFAVTKNQLETKFR